MLFNCISFVLRYDYIDLKGKSKHGRAKNSKSNHNQGNPRLSKSENDLMPFRVSPRPSFTLIDSTTETANNQSKPSRPTNLRWNLKGVSRLISKKGANDQSNKSKARGHKPIGGNPPPSSYSRHHLLQTPEVNEEEDETMFNSYQGPIKNKVLDHYDKVNHYLPSANHEIDNRDGLSKRDVGQDPDIHFKGE